MILEEEKNKYKELKIKLKDYREDLQLSYNSALKMSNPELSQPW